MADEYNEYEQSRTTEEVKVAAEKIDTILVVAAAEAPKTQWELSLALLGETRMLRVELNVSSKSP